MADLLVDTDVFVDHLRGARPLRPGRDRLFYSVITRCELFAGRAADEDALTLLLESFGEILVDGRIAEAAGRLRRTTAVRTPDALIAGTALERDLTLVTRNVRDFRVIRGLRIKSPT